MTNFLIDIQREIQQPVPKRHFKTQVHLLCNFPLNRRISVRLNNIMILRIFTDIRQIHVSTVFSYSTSGPDTVIPDLTIRTAQLQERKPMTCPAHKRLFRNHVRYSHGREKTKTIIFSKTLRSIIPETPF